MSLNDYKRAIELALAMEQPGRLLSLFKDIRSTAGTNPEFSSSLTGHPSVDDVVRTISGADLAKLLRYVRDWNTNSKTSAIAQGILFATFKSRCANDIIDAFGSEMREKSLVESTDAVAKSMGGTAMRDLVDALIPYTERHLSRVDKLLQESYMVDYVLSEMDGGVFGNELVDGLEMDVDTTAS